MRDFNLSAWALRNRSLVLYAMLVLAVAGAWSYRQLGQSEDPPFTFKVMVVQTLWPGATAEEVSRQVTERIERTLMETGQYEFVRSYSRPGESQVIFAARDSMRAREIPELFYQVRKKVGDIRHTLPADVVGPFFNDEFGDTFGNIYALSGDGFDYADLKHYAQRIELALQRLPDVGKVELVGLQDERVYVEISNTRLATLGVPISQVQQALQAQNAMLPAGYFETASDRVQLRVSGRFDSVEAIADLPVRAGDRTFRLGDIAEVERGFAEPAQPRMRFMGVDAVGIAVAMRDGGDILRLGQTLERETARQQQALPVGLELHQVTAQADAVSASVSEFVRVLAEAVAIVLLVSFFSLGFRTGLVVALSIPLVLAMTFVTMHYFGIGLHKISLGALVLALGLMVDDAIIAVEMMAIKLEQGFDRLRAAAFAWESTAFPMLTGTLVTAAGFLPIATAASSTGEYTRSIFEVVTIALLVSWIAAVVFIPYLGDKLLPDPGAPARPPRPGSLAGRVRDARARLAARLPGAPGRWVAPAGPAAHVGVHDPYATRFYTRFRRLLIWCVRRHRLVIALTALAFVLSLAAFRLVPQQFFPDSTRPELMVDLQLAEGASLAATAAEAERLERLIAGRPELVSSVAYVGTGSPRFYLPLDQQLPAPNFAQFVLLTHGDAERERLRDWLTDEIAPQFPDLHLRVTRLETGPPVGYPIQLRVSGEHIDRVQAIARELAAHVREHPDTANVSLDWEAPSKVVRLQLDQARARALGVDSADLAQFLQATLVGGEVSTYREGNELIAIVQRAPAEERASLQDLGSIAVPTAQGGSVPLEQVATLEYGFEHGIIWHRDRQPTVTVRADVNDARLPAQVTGELAPVLADLRGALPEGYSLVVGGSAEDSDKAQASVAAGVPLFVLAVVSILMLQLRSFSRVVLVLLTAPLGLIGVTLFLLAFRVPFGFVAMLGTIALSGMIMRNSVILVDQIEQDIAAGHDRFHAVIDATVRRFRPIVLTALAAVLAMIPLSRSVFFGPMAVAIMGGLVVATVLTLLFLPALYAAWFRVREPSH